jgi:hypothetical protein
MFKNLSHKGNVNQNYIEIPSHPSQHKNNEENKEQQMLVRVGGRKRASYTVGIITDPQKTTNRMTI